MERSLGTVAQPGEQIAAVSSFLQELFGQVPGARGYVEDVSLALHSSRAGESNTTPFVLLPYLCCEIVGGDSRRTVPVMAAWYALMLSARILDDLEDGDTHGPLWVQLGIPRVVNVASGLILAAPLALLRLQEYGVPEGLVLELVEDVQRAAMRVSAGQRAMLVPADVPESAWELAEVKGGVPFALACRSGALVGGGAPEQVERLDEFGRHLGVLTQIADDAADIWQTTNGGDLAAGRRTLPVEYALAVAAPADRAELQRRLDRARRDPAAVMEAQHMLVDLGALHALILETESRRQKALSCLLAVGDRSPARAQLLELVERASGWMNPRR
jgi:geranylgeranyl pyrophosphate synthase